MTGSPDEPSQAALDRWCIDNLGSAPVEQLFATGHLSFVRAYRLADGRNVVLKARPPAARLQACFDVQRHLWQRGYPCPQPLAGPAQLGTWQVTAEVLVHGGEPLGATPDAATKFAAALALQVELTRDFRPTSTLEPAPPWLGGWRHDGTRLWPAPDDLDVDLNAYPEPGWLTDLAQRVAKVLLATHLPSVIGHVDWHQGNLAWLDGNLHVVHDWDSLACLPEAAIAGGASVIYTDSSRAATSLADSQSFLDAYALARGTPWTAGEQRVAHAAGLWNLAFDAKKQTLDNQGASLARLTLEAPRRLDLARA